MQNRFFNTNRLKTEGIYVLISLGISDLFNDIHIITYKLSWKEIFTNLDYVFAFAIFLYCISILARLGILAGKKIIK